MRKDFKKVYIALGFLLFVKKKEIGQKMSIIFFFRI